MDGVGDPTGSNEVVVCSRRPLAMWLVLAGVAASAAVALADVQIGAFVLAAVLLTAGIARAASPAWCTESIGARSRSFDAFAMVALAVAITVLALTAPLL